MSAGPAGCCDAYKFLLDQLEGFAPPFTNNVENYGYY